MFDQSQVKPYDAPELGVVFGAKIRGQYEYITAADVIVTGTQSGQAIVDLPNLIVQGMHYQFSVPAETWSGPEQRGLVPSFRLNDTAYSVDRSSVQYATYPTSENRHRVYEQYGVDDYFWSTPLELAWRIEGSTQSVEGTSTLTIPQFWPLPGIVYDPDRANLTELYGGNYEQVVWSGVIDGLPIDAVAYAHVVGVLVPEPPGPRPGGGRAQRDDQVRLPANILHDVNLAAIGPANNREILPQHPEGGPKPFPGGDFDARFNTPELEGLQSLGLEPR